MGQGNGVTSEALIPPRKVGFFSKGKRPTNPMVPGGEGPVLAMGDVIESTP
jgi:hypothetical protein